MDKEAASMSKTAATEPGKKSSKQMVVKPPDKEFKELL